MFTHPADPLTRLANATSVQRGGRVPLDQNLLAALHTSIERGPSAAPRVEENVTAASPVLVKRPRRRSLEDRLQHK